MEHEVNPLYRCRFCEAKLPRSDFGSYRNGRRHDLCHACQDERQNNRAKPQKQKEVEIQQSEAALLLQWVMRQWAGHASES